MHVITFFALIFIVFLKVNPLRFRGGTVIGAAGVGDLAGDGGILFNYTPCREKIMKS